MCVCVGERETKKQPFCNRNYAKNGRKNNKFIESVNMKRQNKGKWIERWIVTLRLRVVGRWKGKGGKDGETK